MKIIFFFEFNSESSGSESVHQKRILSVKGINTGQLIMKDYAEKIAGKFTKLFLKKFLLRSNQRKNYNDDY